MGNYKYVGMPLIIALLCSIYTAKTYSQKTECAMNELSNKLIETEAGIWTLRGSGNESNYIYSFMFSEENKVIFSYSTSNKSERIYALNVLRHGTFETKGNVLTISFSSAKGSKYGMPNYSDEPLPEDLCVKIEVEIVGRKIMVKEHRGKGFYLRNPDYVNRDIEITEYTLITKQISGENIFENHNENTTLELIAERPIID